MNVISSLKERLVEDMKDAMKDKDSERLSVIRMARAAIKNQEIKNRKDLDDKEIVAILAKEVKQRKESIEEYEKVKKTDVVTSLEREIDILEQYLPEQMKKEEIHDLIEETIQKVGADSLNDLGKVMGKIMPEVKGRADGKVVNELVRKKLS